VAHQNISQGGFTRPVWTHQTVNFALVHGEIDPFEDLFPLNGGVQILDF
jgi:hypothetical protein